MISTAAKSQTAQADRIFSIRGTDYYIDLSQANGAQFDKALKPYVEATVKVRDAKTRAPKKQWTQGSVALTGAARGNSRVGP